MFIYKTLLANEIASLYIYYHFYHNLLFFSKNKPIERVFTKKSILICILLAFYIFILIFAFILDLSNIYNNNDL